MQNKLYLNINNSNTKTTIDGIIKNAKQRTIKVRHGILMKLKITKHNSNTTQNSIKNKRHERQINCEKQLIKKTNTKYNWLKQRHDTKWHNTTNNN